MFVNLPLSNQSDSSGRDAKSECYLRVGTDSQSNGLCLLVCKFGVWSAFAMLIGLSILLNHVAKIIGASAKPKMGRVDAVANVAGMANKEAIWNWPMFGNPSRSMCTYANSLEAKDAIACFVNMAGPQNAAIGLRGRVKRQFLRQRDFLWSEAVLTFFFSQDRPPQTVKVRAGDGVCALFRPVHYSTSHG